MEILVGTTNPGKLREIESGLAGLDITLLSLVDSGPFPAVIEDGKTYEENALKKARTLAQCSGRIVLADDSGLEVQAIGDAPGVHSARYAGEPSHDRRNNEKLLSALTGVPRAKRAARFVCVLALCLPPGLRRREWVFRAECAGLIGLAPRGSYGFGYDPLFYYPPLRKTFGELDAKTKSRVSHRGKALKTLRAALAEMAGRGRIV